MACGRFGLAATLVLMVFLLSAAGLADAAVPDGPVSLRNYWKQDQLLGVAQAAPTIGAEAQAWIVEPVQGQDAVRLRATGSHVGYLLLDNGALSLAPAAPENFFAWWHLIPVPNTESYRLQHHVWPERFVHIEQGPLEGSNIHFGAWSSWWLLEPAPEAQSADRSGGIAPTPVERRVLDVFGREARFVSILQSAVVGLQDGNADPAAVQARLQRIAEDPGERADLLPYLLESAYTALSADNPDPVQAAFRDSFGHYYAREQQLKARYTLRQWLDYTHQPLDMVILESGAAAIAPEIVIGTPTTDPAPAGLSVLLDTGPKLSGFRPNEDNPLLLTERGKAAMEVLLAPSVLDSMVASSGIKEELQNEQLALVERPSPLDQVLTRLGFTGGAAVGVTGLALAARSGQRDDQARTWHQRKGGDQSERAGEGRG